MRRIAVTAASVLAAALALAGSVQADAGGSPASGWHVGYYTPSSHGALSFAEAASVPGGVAGLNFTNQPNTALLVTSQQAQFGSLLGNLNGKTITATFSIAGADSPFTYFGEGTSSNPCGTPANTRLYFETSNAGGFDFTHFWWANPDSQTLVNGNNLTLTATVEPAEWSDWNGQNGATVPDAFASAAGNVTKIGLSFGGGCFFENGVGTADGSGSLTLDSYSAS